MLEKELELMAGITGVGGIFLNFEGDKDLLHNWYHTTLGLDMTDYGTGFLEGRQMMLVSFKSEHENAPIINFRVEDIEAISENLNELGLDVKQIDEYEYGKFMQFIDPFGNLIELWEPYEEPYLNMVRQEIEGYLKKTSGNTDEV
jgi:predicted enzyme related to lactoylglutathione lyase